MSTLPVFTPDATIAELDAQTAAFRFVALLAAEVSKGQVDLPAFPEVVARVKSALSNEQVSPAMIARVVASEAGLAARMMTMANSVIMNPSGTPITELKSAVVRIGYNNVRASAVAYAIGKLRHASELHAIRPQLEQLWNEATGTAALAYALARRTPHINADEAMLTGLVHNIGKLYILSRSQRLANAKFGVPEMTVIMRDWHANVGKAIVESWKFAPQIAVAIGDYEDQEREIRQADLGDVLSVASQLCPYVSKEQQDRVVPPELLRSGAGQRLGMNLILVQQILHDGAAALGELRAALGN